MRRERVVFTNKERLQSAWHRFEEEHEHAPTGTRAVVHWAVSQGLLELPDIDPYEVLAGHMANALREEYRTDLRGRRYRVNHARRITKGGVQHTLWGQLGYSPHEHMEKSFGQRREQIVGDCVQLRTDVEAYNDLSKEKNGQKILLVLDFTEDVEERLTAA